MRAVHSLALFVAFTSTACLDISDASLGDNDAGGSGGTSSAHTGGGGAGGQTGGAVAGTGGMDQLVEGAAPGWSEGEEATCAHNVTPCGGDVVGTWKVTSSCLQVSGTTDLSDLGLGCRTAQITEGSLEVTGTWRADDMETYTDKTIVTGTETLELPRSCLIISGTTTSCDSIATPLAAGRGYEMVTCVDNDATQGCTCQATVNQTGGLGVAPLVYAFRDGDYVIADDTLTILPDEQEYLYCVTGTTLIVTPKSVGKTGTVTGTVVLEKE